MTKAEETPWLRTADGRVRLPVLREFSFIHKVQGGTGTVTLLTGRARKFTVGEHVLDPKDRLDAEVLNHPWVYRDLADGYIENPVKSRERLEAEAQKAAEIQARQEAILRESQAALERAEVAAEKAGDAGEDVQSELDTPINQPRVRSKSQQKRLAALDPEALKKDLDTPIGQLPRG